LETRAQQAVQATGAVGAGTREMRQEVEALRVHPDLLSQLRLELAKLQEMLDKLAREIEALRLAAKDTGKERPAETAADAGRKLDGLRQRQAALLQEHADLERRLQEEGKSALPPGILIKKRSQFAALVKNRFVPIKAPYFKQETKFEGDRTWVEVTRVSEGEDYNTAIADRGCLHALCGELKPDEECLFLFVCADSIDCFRLVVNEMRRRKIDVRWDTYDGGTLYRNRGPIRGGIGIR
jgi:hypothetical protein